MVFISDYLLEFYGNRVFISSDVCDCSYVLRDLSARGVGGTPVTPLSRHSDVTSGQRSTVAGLDPGSSVFFLSYPLRGLFRLFFLIGPTFINLTSTRTLCVCLCAVCIYVFYTQRVRVFVPRFPQESVLVPLPVLRMHTS